MKHRIKIDLNKRGRETENLPIRIRVTFGGDRLDLATGFSVDLDQWNAVKGQVKQGISNAQGYTYSQINRGLASRVNFINEHFIKADLGGKIPSKKELKELFNAEFAVRGQMKEDKTFFYYFDLFVSERGREGAWTPNTYEKFGVVKKHLMAHNPKMTFDYLDKGGLGSYLEYLKALMTNETVKRQLGFLKTFLRWSMDEGYNANTDFMGFKPKLTTTNNTIIALSWEELMTVWSFEIPETKNYLKQVRDVFCFCCFTSLRYSDAFNLRRANVKKDHITITTKKTNDTLTIELNDYSKEILDNYKDIPFKDHKALPVISNQKMNDYLKELGQLCELNEEITIVTYKGNERVENTYFKHELLSTHCARRTFISNAISLGVPPQVVMQWSGHSDYKSMRPYIGIANKTKVEAMKVFNKKY